MVKRFRQDKAVWLSYGTFLLQQGQSDAASVLLQRALKSLPSKESKMALSKRWRCSVMHIYISERHTYYWWKQIVNARVQIRFPCPGRISTQALTFMYCHASSQVWMWLGSLLSWSSVMVTQREVASCLTKSWRATQNVQTSGQSSSIFWSNMDRRRKSGELALLSVHK